MKYIEEIDCFHFCNTSCLLKKILLFMKFVKSSSFEYAVSICLSFRHRIASCVKLLSVLLELLTPPFGISGCIWINQLISRGHLSRRTKVLCCWLFWWFLRGPSACVLYFHYVPVMVMIRVSPGFLRLLLVICEIPSISPNPFHLNFLVFEIQLCDLPVPSTSWLFFW